MRVFLDGRRARWNSTTGTGVYARRLIDQLATIPGIDIRALEASRLVDLAAPVRASSGRIARWAAKLASDLIEVPIAARGSAVRHMLYPEAWLPGPSVTTIQDLSVLDERFRDARSAIYYSGWHRLAARTAAWIICPSRLTADQLAARFGRSERVAVIHHGIDRPEGLAWKADRVSPYVVYAGGFARRKNISILLEAWTSHARRIQGELLITGGGFGALPVAHIRATGRVSRDELWRLYSRCTAVVYPSLAEGFGFPAIEAAALGVPVVCGPTGVVPELPPGLVRTVDVSSAAAVAGGLANVLDGWRPDEDAVRWARDHFTWQRCARGTAEVYRACVQGGHGQ